MEWEHGVRCLHFPNDEDRDAENTDHEGSNHWGSVPLGLDTTSKGEGLPDVSIVFEAVT